MMKCYPIILLVLFVVLISGAYATANVSAQSGDIYYVATVAAGGSDSNDGSLGNPWATIQHAAGQVTAGDTVLINPGTYNGNIIVDTSGTAAEPITFRANGSGVVIDGTVNNWSGDAFLITGADYIIVEGLTIQDADRAGLRISLSDHVTVRDCTFANNYRWGIFTDFSDYTTVENSESYGASDEHGIYISNSSDYPTIRGNRLHHNAACGLHMNGDISMGGDGIISEATVEDNIIYENGTSGGSGINMDGVTNSIIRNNLLYNNHASGISIYQIDGGSGSHDNQVLNNTILMASDGRWGVNIPNTNDTNNKLFNNIVYNYHSWRGSITIASPTLSGFESDYNVVMDRFSTDDGNSQITFTAWQALGYDTHSIIATPDQLFIDHLSDDYHLKSSSPARNSGITLANVSTDLEGHPRPAELFFDIGAYEFSPALDLQGHPDDSTIHLTWTVNTTIPLTSTWRISYVPVTGGTTIVDTDTLTSTARAYPLIGLINYTTYTITLEAMLNAAPFLTDTIQATPTDIAVYLPIITKS